MAEQGGSKERTKKTVQIKKKGDPDQPPSEVNKNKSGSISISRRVTAESLVKEKADPPMEGVAEAAKTVTDQNAEKAALEKREADDSPEIGAAADSTEIGAADPSEPKTTAAEEGGTDIEQTGPEPEVTRETSLVTESQKLRQMAEETGDTASDAKGTEGTESSNEPGQAGEQDEMGENNGSKMDAWNSVLTGHSDHLEGMEPENRPPSDQAVELRQEAQDEAAQNENTALEEALGVAQDGENVEGVEGVVGVVVGVVGVEGVVAVSESVPDGEDVRGNKVTNEEDIPGEKVVKTDDILEEKPSGRDKKEVEREAEVGKQKQIEDQKGYASSKRNEELPIMLERSKPSENFIGTDRKSMVRPGILIIKEKERARYDVRFAIPEKILAYNVGAKVSGRFSTLTAEMEGDWKDNKKNSGSAKTSVWTTQTGSQKMSNGSMRGSVKDMATNTETAPQRENMPTASEPMDYYRQFYIPQMVPWPANTSGYYSSLGNYPNNVPYNSNNPNNPPNNCNPNK